MLLLIKLSIIDQALIKEAMRTQDLGVDIKDIVHLVIVKDNFFVCCNHQAIVK